MSWRKMKQKIWLKAGLLCAHLLCAHLIVSRSGSRRIHKKENKVKTDRVYFRSMCLEGKNELSACYFQGKLLARSTGMMS